MLLINYNFRDQGFTQLSPSGKSSHFALRSDLLELQHGRQTAHKQMMTVVSRIYVDIQVFKQSYATPLQSYF